LDEMKWGMFGMVASYGLIGLVGIVLMESCIWCKSIRFEVCIEASYVSVMFETICQLLSLLKPLFSTSGMSSDRPNAITDPT
jgi:H+/Cl- antiporter ClcA